MFSITPSEVIVIVIVALIVFGPRRLVEVSRKAGQIAGQLRRTADELRTGLEEEIRSVKEPLDEMTKPLREAQYGLAAAGKELYETAEGELRWADEPAATPQAEKPATPQAENTATSQPENTASGGSEPAAAAAGATSLDQEGRDAGGADPPDEREDAEGLPDDE